MTVSTPPVLSPDLRALLDAQSATVTAEATTLLRLLPEALEPGTSLLWASPTYRAHAARLAWRFSEQPNIAPHP